MRVTRALLTCLLGAFAFAGVHAQSISITGGVTDGEDCAALGTWNPGNDSCVIDFIQLGAGETLSVDGATLILDGLIVGRGANADVINAGRLWTSGLLNRGTLTGTADTDFDITGQAGPGGLRENFGTIQIAGEVRFNVYETFHNHLGGNFVLTGPVVIYGSTPFENFGSMSFSQLETEVDVVNHTTGSLVFDGLGANFVFGVTLTNHGRVDNVSTSFGGIDWTVVNEGVFNNYDRAGNCDEYGGLNSFINNGTFNNTGMFWVCANFENNGVLNNSGTIITGTTVPGGNTIVNPGQLYDCGSIAPSVSGNPPIVSSDPDGDGWCGTTDCAPAIGSLWRASAAPMMLRLTKDGQNLDTAHLNWLASNLPGGSTPRYDVIASTGPNNFDIGEFCVETDDSSDLTATDSVAIGVGEVRYYLIRSENDCGSAVASSSSGGDRLVTSCP